MKKISYAAIASFALLMGLTGCSTPETKTTETTAPVTETTAAKPDFAKMKSDIQAIETSWANADNARDTNTIGGFYADDAVSMGNNKPMLVGKVAIVEDIKSGLAKRAKGSVIAFDVMDVYGSENQVTEVGKTTVKDATGKVTYTGKYMAVWEMRNGKYLCVRDIGNDDVKEK